MANTGEVEGQIRVLIADDYGLLCVVVASPGRRYKLIFEPAGDGKRRRHPLNIVLCGKSGSLRSPLSSSTGSSAQYGRRYYP